VDVDGDPIRIPNQGRLAVHEAHGGLCGLARVMANRSPPAHNHAARSRSQHRASSATELIGPNRDLGTPTLSCIEPKHGASRRPFAPS